MSQTAASLLATFLFAPVLGAQPVAPAGASAAEPAPGLAPDATPADSGAQDPPTPPPPVEPPAAEPPAEPPPPSPSDPVPEVTPPTRPAEAPARLVRKEYETPPADEAEGARSVRTLRTFDFGLELDLGTNQRFGGAATFARHERLDVAYGLGFWLSLDELVALGLELEHVGLGTAADDSGANVLNAEYAATSASVSGRFAPVRGSNWEPFVALRVGLALEHVEANGLRADDSPFESPRAFSCAETGGPGLALGGGVGAAMGLGARLRLLARLDADAHRLSSDPIHGCAVGLGTVTSVSLGLGLVYGFDGPGSSSAAGERGATLARAAAW